MVTGLHSFYVITQQDKLNISPTCMVLLVVYAQFVCSIFQGKLNTYRFCDNVWTFVLNNVEFREQPVAELARVDKVKIVACDGKSE